MVAFVFEGEMNIESVSDLMRGIDEMVLQFGAEQQLIIYVNSEGGEIRASNILADYLNLRKLPVTLVGVEYLMSAALTLFLEYEGPKRILDDTWGMIHLGHTQVQTSALKDSKSMDTFRSKMMEDYSEKFLITLKKVGLDEHLIEEVEKGKDVYLKTEILRKILKAEK